MCSGTETLCLLPPPFVDASGGHMLRTQRGRLTRWESRWCTYVYENATLLRILRRNRIRTQAASAHEVVGSGATHGHSYISCDVCCLKCSSSTLFIANANGNMSRLSYIL